jgi:phage gp36-like protein
MPYATPQQFIDTYTNDEAVQLSEIDNPAAGAVNDAQIGDAIADAQREIDGYLAVRYALPLVIVPDIIRLIALRIARKNLDLLKPREIVLEDYKTALDWLKQIAAGKLALVLPDGTVLPPLTAPVVSGTIAFGVGERIFTRETLDSYQAYWQGRL